MPVRKVNILDIEMESIRGNQESTPKCKRCRRAEVDSKGRLLCLDPEYCGKTLGDRWQGVADGKCDEIEPEARDDCDMFDPIGMRFPLEVDDVLIEHPKMGEPLGHKIGQIVAVRPCKADFGGKTYLGVLAGEMPVRIGLKYDRAEKELLVYNGFPNPLIIIPEVNAAVYGYESWWQAIETPEDLAEITDEQIMSQPYMAALAKLYAEGDGAED